jgi:hypothetical protein
MTAFPKKIFVGILLLILTLVAIYFSSDLLRSFGMRSDEELKIVFAKHPDSFGSLERLVLNDPTLFYVSESEFFRRDDVGIISRSKTTDEYRAVFNQIEVLTRGSKDKVSDLAFFAFPSSMIPVDRSDPNQSLFQEKGYALILAPDEHIAELLGTGKVYGNIEFKQIAQRWYIYKRAVVSKPE